MKRNFFSLLMIILIACCCFAVPTFAEMNDGVYMAAAKGRNDMVHVSVLIENGKIESVEVTEHAETPGICQMPIEMIPQEIISGQTLAVDSVTGATLTSQAILAAVTDCVTQAGGDVEALSCKNEIVSTDTTHVEMSADVVVVGAGGAGMSAAMAAKENGASVIVLEKMPYAGGSTALSGGLFNAAGTVQQIAQGITEDSIEQHIEDTWNRGDQKGNIELVTLLCNNTIPTMSWLEGIGLIWSPEVQQKPDCTYPRSHTPIRPDGYTGKLGYIITDTLSAALKDSKQEILLNTPVTGLISENDAVTGVTAQGADGTTYSVYAKSVVLTAGGFGANGDMVHQYDETIPANCANSVHPGATGEVLNMAKDIGANLVGMDYIKSLLYSNGATTSFVNAVMIDEKGQRFVNELAKAEELNKALYMLDSDKVFMVYDASVVGDVNESIQKKLDNGDLYRADTLEALADLIGVDAGNLSKTIASYNDAVDQKAEDAFGRTTFKNKIVTAPYYAAVPYVQVAYTNGGVEINTSFEVLNTSGEVIDGLFAAGEITGGVHGSYRVGGNAVAESITFGRMCGASAAQSALAE